MQVREASLSIGFEYFVPCDEVLGESLLLDGEKVALEGGGRGGKKGAAVAADKAAAAMKSHSEAERRRRERINSHLNTLRGLVSSNEKMDKAALLAEVVSQVVQLRKSATQAASGLLVPMDSDEVKVEQYSNQATDGVILFKASFCCEFRPDLLSSVRKALEALPLKIVRVEVSTLETRLKNVIIFRSLSQESATRHCPLGSCVHEALKSLLDKNTADLTDFSPRATMIRPGKRRRVSSNEHPIATA
ncbi:hypothetical protein MLD38_021175 [Melastoma candidum]|uniref:Uncharacterized protein n=1 Tax=Melastoma candidum TaxID=119954 RepID=A0ACB9QG72_9MYRT|nr:hypothetical protein MLD38_021175 [Melastoma candidum]